MEPTGGVDLNRQLELLTHRAARGQLIPTAALARDRRRELVLSKVRYVRLFFPELDEITLRVGLTRRAAGLAEIEGRTLWLNPHKLALHTIAHELTHLLQGRGHVPGGERSCDVFAVARDASLVDVLPCYLELPPAMADARGWLRPGAGRLLHELARDAVTRRRAGLRRYIRWFEDAATRRWRDDLWGVREHSSIGRAATGGAARGSRAGARRGAPVEDAQTVLW